MTDFDLVVRNGQIHDGLGGQRLHQEADGYLATICSGVLTYRNGQATGALPGRLVRGSQRPS